MVIAIRNVRGGHPRRLVAPACSVVIVERDALGLQPCAAHLCVGRGGVGSSSSPRGSCRRSGGSGVGSGSGRGWLAARPTARAPCMSPRTAIDVAVRRPLALHRRRVSALTDGQLALGTSHRAVKHRHDLGRESCKLHGSDRSFHPFGTGFHPEGRENRAAWSVILGGDSEWGWGNGDSVVCGGNSSAIRARLALEPLGRGTPTTDLGGRTCHDSSSDRRLGLSLSR